MWYKRYGYRDPPGRSSESFKVIIVAFFMLILTLYVCLYFQSWWPVTILLPTTIYALTWADETFSLKRNSLRKKRRKMHINNAFKCYENGDTEKFRESIRKAKIYGEIPEELEKIENA